MSRDPATVQTPMYETAHFAVDWVVRDRKKAYGVWAGGKVLQSFKSLEEAIECADEKERFIANAAKGGVAAEEVVERVLTVQTRLLDNPLISRAEKLAQLDKRPNDPKVGKEYVDVNLQTRLGGYSRFKNRTAVREETAAKFLAYYERGMIGGGTDYTIKEPVDSSGVSPELNLIKGQDARKLMIEAQMILQYRYDFLEWVIVRGETTTELAKRYPRMFTGKEKTARMKAADAIQEALDILAEKWGMVTISVLG